MNLRELVDTVDVPETRVAEEAWDRAHTRLVRRRAWATGAVGVAAAMVLVAAAAVPAGDRAERPTPLTPDPSPTVAPSDAAESHLPVTIARPDWEALGVAPALAPSAEVAALSQDPVEHAALVMGDPEDQAAAYVLGDDGVWRRLDVAGLEPTTDGLYTSSLVRPTGLNADGTRLAIPQHSQLVVVDLTTGEAARYGVRGPQHFVLWVDDTHVLVGLEGAGVGTLIDTATGELEESDLGPTSRVTDDGGFLTWPRGSGSYAWKGGTTTSVVMNGGVFETAPLLRDELAVITTAGGPVRTPPLPYPPPVMLREVGITAVDLVSGDPVGFIPLSPTAKGTVSVLLGWRGDDPVLGLVNETLSSLRIFVAVWDVQGGTFAPLATLPSWDVSWGTGL